jgi:hypothetical protein
MNIVMKTKKLIKCQLIQDKLNNLEKTELQI